MRLIKNWKSVALRAHSMWAVYLGVMFLALPDLIYVLLGVDTNPRLWFALGVVCLLYGGFGRLWDQGIDRNKLQSPWVIGLAVLVLLVAGFAFFDHGRAPVVGDAGPVVSGPVDPGPPARDAGSGVMPVSDAEFLELAVPFVGRWEGLRLAAYRDLVGVLTVCYGHTKGVRAGDEYTKAECDAMLARDLLTYRGGLHRYFTSATRTTRLPGERDVAFVSLAVNVGISGAGKSTATRRLNAGNIAGACEAIGWWNRAGGRVVRGLVLRRAEERDKCMLGVV